MPVDAFLWITSRKEKLRLQQAKQEEMKSQLAHAVDCVYWKVKIFFFQLLPGNAKRMCMNCWQVLQKDSLEDDNVIV